MNKTKVEITSFFNERLLEFKEQLAAAKVGIKRLSTFRVIIFLSTVIGIYFATGVGWTTVIAVSVIGFGFFIFLPSMFTL